MGFWWASGPIGHGGGVGWGFGPGSGPPAAADERCEMTTCCILQLESGTPGARVMELNMSSLRVFIVGMCVLASSLASPQMVRWSGNGNFYERVPTWRTWLEARDDAASRTFLGVKGHLMTLTSSGEQAFIVATFGEPLREGSLGGFKAGGVWRWVTREPWNYTNWAPGEPNGSDYLAFHGGSFLGSWNDRPNSDTRHYFVEYPVRLVDSLPSSCIINKGTLLGGTLFELLISDNTYMTLQSVASFLRTVPDVQVEITGVVPAGAVSVVGFVVESAVSTTNVKERVEMFDFIANQWVLLGERFPTLPDTEAVSATTVDAGRFIQPGTREIRARIGWFDQGAPVRNWLVRIDKAVFGVAFQ